jgi:hypothetical protein
MNKFRRVEDFHRINIDRFVKELGGYYAVVIAGRKYSLQMDRWGNEYTIELLIDNCRTGRCWKLWEQNTAELGGRINRKGHPDIPHTIPGDTGQWLVFGPNMKRSRHLLIHPDNPELIGTRTEVGAKNTSSIASEWKRREIRFRKSLKPGVKGKRWRDRIARGEIIV